MSRRGDAGPPLERALHTVDGLKAGSWESVETCALLGLELLAAGRYDDAERLHQQAAAAAGSLKPGGWESARALTWLARLQRELAAR